MNESSVIEDIDRWESKAVFLYERAAEIAEALPRGRLLDNWNQEG